MGVFFSIVCNARVSKLLPSPLHLPLLCRSALGGRIASFPHHDLFSIAACGICCSSRQGKTFVVAVPQTPTPSPSIIPINTTSEYRLCQLSLQHVVSLLSLLLPRVRYSFCTNLFKQLQRLHDPSKPNSTLSFLQAQIALYRNPTSYAHLVDALPAPLQHSSLVLLSRTASELTLGNSRSNMSGWMS